MTQTTKVAHRTVKVRDQDIFYREAVPKDAPAERSWFGPARCASSEAGSSIVFSPSRVIALSMDEKGRMLIGLEWERG